MRRRLFIPQRQIACLALLAILLHAALPFMHGLLQTPARGFYTTLCAAGSPQQQHWIALDAPTRPDTDPQQTPRCPLCVAGAHFALPPPPPALALLRSDLLQSRPLAPEQELLRPVAASPYDSRAPPLA